METLKYKVITSEKQYDKYCRILHDLDFSEAKKTKAVDDEIDLLTLLIEKWDEQHRNFNKLNPVELLHSLMDDHKMQSKDLAEILGVNKSFVSEILHYKKGLSKESIRKLADKFKLSQEAFNRPYKLKSPANLRARYARARKSGKK